MATIDEKRRDKANTDAMAQKVEANPLGKIQAELAPLRDEVAQLRQEHALASAELQPAVDRGAQRQGQYQAHTGSVPLSLRQSLHVAAQLTSTANLDQIDLRLSNVDRAPNPAEEPRRIRSLITTAREAIPAMARLALELEQHIEQVEESIIRSADSAAATVPLTDRGTNLGSTQL